MNVALPAVRMIVAVALLAGCLALSGCALPGALAYKLGGEPKIPAQYVPAPEPMLVLAENFQSPSSASYEAERISHEVSRLLEKKKVAPLVPASKLATLRLKGDANQMKISDLGQAVGAKQVLYIDIRQSTVERLPGTDWIKGQMSVLVRVVDSDSGQLRWPAHASDGYPLSTETQYHSLSQGATDMTLRQQMCERLSLQIARLFYPYRQDDSEYLD